MPGYQLSGIDRSGIDEWHLCPKCNELLKEAVQTIACGHRYCKACVEDILSQGPGKCAIDGAIIHREQVFQDRFVEREIQSLILHCVNHEHGCEWKDELRKREAHEAVCECVKVPCVHCGELGTRAQLADHLVQRCQYRLEACGYCHSLVTFAVMKEHHETQCPAVLIECAKCNRKDIPRGRMASHIDAITGDCEEVIAPCPWSQIGCPESKEMKRSERRHHDDSSVVSHLLFLLCSVVRLRNQIGFHDEFHDLRSCLMHVEDTHAEPDSVQAGRHGSLNAQYQQIIYVLHDVRREISNIQGQFANQELRLAEANQAIHQQNNEIVWLKRQYERNRDLLRRLQAKVDSMDEAMRTRNLPQVAGLQINRDQEPYSFDGVLLWRISNIGDKIFDSFIEQGKSFYSPPFYTSRQGYKVCARIYLSGDGTGKGTHISLFFVVMRGEYDALLRWPFRQKVTFMLVDQNNREHVIDAFRPDPNSSSFHRPRRETNIASGCPLFFPLTELNRHAYIKDDVMFVKVIVDCSDL